MSDAHSTSSLPNLLTSHLNSLHSISQEGFDQSSLNECFRSQVSELLSSKEEIISLKSQLKMSQEANQLRDAEFAFQRKQYEDEIESLKKKEQELIETVAKFQKDVIQTHKYDVQVMLNQKDDQISQITNKYQKWKNKYHSMSSEFEKMKEISSNLENSNQELNNKLSAQTEEIEKLKQASLLSTSSIPEKQTVDKNNQDQFTSLSVQIQKLEEQLTQSKNESQSIQDELNAQIASLENEKASLEKRLEKASAKVIKQQVKINNLSDENKSISSSTMEFSNQMEKENQQLRSKAKTYRKQKQAYEEQLQQMQSMMQHVELERDSIADILGIEPDDISQHWEKMTKKVEQLTNDVSSVNELKSQNEKLQKRLNAALEDSRKPSSASKTQFKNQDSYISSLQTNLKAARNEIQAKNKILARNAIIFALNQAIERMNHDILGHINNLFFSLTGEINISLRPIILAIIMINRFARLNKIESESDPTALQVFGEISSFPLRTKIDIIRNKFTSLTQELLLLKQSVKENNVLMENLIEERDVAQITLRSNSDEMDINRKKMKYLKKRMLELQTELSSLVSPEIYNDVCSSLEIVERKNKDLEEKVKELELEIDKRTELERTMNERVEKYQISADQSSKIAHQTRAQYAAKEEEIERLKLMLKDKTKEILALERLVHLQEEKESNSKATYNCLAIENQELKRKSEITIQSTTSKLTKNDSISSTSTLKSDLTSEEEANMTDLKKAIKIEINPAFLGK